MFMLVYCWIYCHMMSFVNHCPEAASSLGHMSYLSSMALLRSGRQYNVHHDACCHVDGVLIVVSMLLFLVLSLLS